jgi:hypothetical protein
MGGFFSGRFPRDSRPKRNSVKEKSLVLDARELVKSRLILAGKRRSAAIEVCTFGAAPRGFIDGRLYVDARDTQPLWVQSEPRHRIELGLMILEYTWRGSPTITKAIEDIAATGHWGKIILRQGQPITQEISMIAGLTRLDVVFWGFECPRCHRYARKLFLPLYRYLFLCRTCHGLRYTSQAKLDKISRELGDQWGATSRAMGLPDAKFLEAIERAGRCVFPWRVPSRI